jgi:hypothetical protein
MRSAPEKIQVSARFSVSVRGRVAMRVSARVRVRVTMRVIALSSTLISNPNFEP